MTISLASSCVSVLNELWPICLKVTAFTQARKKVFGIKIT